MGCKRRLWWMLTVLAPPLSALAAVDVPSSAVVQPCPPPEIAEPRRRSPRIPVLPYEPTPCDASRLPPSPLEQSGGLQGLPDRWRLIESIGIPDNWIDPYHGNNPLKGDRPLFGEDWFLALIGVSDSVIEPRQFPVPVGGPVTERAGSLDTFGAGRQQVYAQTLALETVLYQGDTVFKPPDWEFRLTPVVNINHVLVEERGLLKANVDARRTRTESAVGLQAAFVDKHLRNVSDRYDFDSLRVGVQPFTADFRGFLLNDSLFGVRLFGIRDDNRWQYNLAWFRRIDKDTNSGLNDLIERGAAALRDDDVFVINAYYQDWSRLGFTVQGTILHNRNREGGELTYDGNGIIQRPMSLGLERSANTTSPTLAPLVMVISGASTFPRVRTSRSVRPTAGYSSIAPSKFVLASSLRRSPKISPGSARAPRWPGPRAMAIRSMDEARASMPFSRILYLRVRIRASGFVSRCR